MSASFFDTEPDVVYKKTTGGQELKIDIFKPKTKIKTTVLYAHGGGFTKGSHKENVAARLATKLCKQGVLVVSAGYRLKTDITAFSPENRHAILRAQTRTGRVGMPISPKLCGPMFYAALEDLSDAIGFLRSKNGPLTANTGPVLVLGVSAGGIAALSLAFPPSGIWENVNQPDAVISLCAAMVQPWRLTSGGIPSLLFNGCTDRVISPKNTAFTAHRVATTSAPLEVIVTDTPGHNTQIDLFIDGNDPDGKPWLDRARHMMKL